MVLSIDCERDVLFCSGEHGLNDHAGALGAMVDRG